MSNSLALIEFMLIFSGVIGFGLWELYSLKRDKKNSKDSGSRYN